MKWNFQVCSQKNSCGTSMGLGFWLCNFQGGGCHIYAHNAMGYSRKKKTGGLRGFLDFFWNSPMVYILFLIETQIFFMHNSWSKKQRNTKPILNSPKQSTQKITSTSQQKFKKKNLLRYTFLPNLHFGICNHANPEIPMY